MAAFIQDKSRRVIPQWRSASVTTASGELDSLVPRGPTATPDLTTLEERTDEWKKNRTTAFAAEVLAVAEVLGTPEQATEAAEFILAQDAPAPRTVRWLAEHILGRGPEDEASEGNTSTRIRILRRFVREDPRNSIRWADLAREYALVGLLTQSQAAMKIAVDLAPEVRYISRAAARLFVHAGDPEFSHYVLLRSKRLEQDPWLLAAEIAICSVLGESSEYLKVGRQMLESQHFPAFHRSELASAIATVEIDSGRIKIGKKLFRQALVQPTSNSVGQVRWAQKLIGLEIGEAAFQVERAYEARAWNNFYAADWKVALTQSEAWRLDEGYSSRPPALGSYIAAAILQDYSRAADIALRGLAANPADPSLLNNLIFSLIYSGHLAQAAIHMKTFQSLDLGTADQIVRSATEGLLQFRNGEPDRGRASYSAAMEGARKRGLKLLLARAAVNLALEENRLRSTSAEGARRQAIELSREIPDADLRIILQRL